MGGRTAQTPHMSLLNLPSFGVLGLVFLSLNFTPSISATLTLPSPPQAAREAVYACNLLPISLGIQVTPFFPAQDGQALFRGFLCS